MSDRKSAKSHKQELGDKPTLSAGEVFAFRLGQVRRRKGWSQQQLSDRLAELGRPIHRVTLAKYESGGLRARNVPLEDVLAVALALGVAPTALFTPYGEQKLQLAPSFHAVSGEVARKWVRGRGYIGSSEKVDTLGAGPGPRDREWSEGLDPEGYRFFFSELPPEEVAAYADLLDRTEPGVPLPAEAHYLRERREEQ